MKSNNKQVKLLSRRQFIGITAGTAVAFSVLPSLSASEPDKKEKKAKKPDSKFGGVQIGAITYSWRSMPGTAEDTLKYCIETGISSIELMSNVPELYAGAPQLSKRPAFDAPDAEKEAFRKEMTAMTEKMKVWRSTVPMDKFVELRKMYNKAGVNIHIVKFSPENWSDEEIDYAFRAAKAMGAKGVSTEIGEKSAQKLGPIAEKHGMFNIIHNHGQPGQPGFTFDKFLEFSPANMLNFDAGHYFGATGNHPNELIKRLHSRIFSIHMKDKTGPKSTPKDTNMEWGKGETPIKDILLLLKTEKWPINVDIELEYQVPAGSDSVAEVRNNHRDHGEKDTEDHREKRGRPQRRPLYL
jgi:sugar phosphate isomerase/epimerase